MNCFVISPIGEEGSPIRNHADDVYEYIIKPAMKKFGIRPVRSDQMSDTGRITEQMFREILNADLCVAVLTRLDSGFNPNVFYELAVAQCAARPVIILIEKGQTLPFDVKDLRCIEYDLHPISRLVREQHYAKKVIAKVRKIRDQGWTVPGLFEQFDFPELRDEQQLRRMIRAAAPKPLDSHLEARYRLAEGSDQELVVMTGDIVKLHDIAGFDKQVDVIVSLENTFLQLARFFDASISGSISGTLRYMDARKSETGGVAEDSLYESLQAKLAKDDIHLPVPLGSVIATPATQLADDFGVKYIFHVAAMRGSPGDGYSMLDGMLDDCVEGAYSRFAHLVAEGGDLRSILFPMLGAASTHLDPLEVARRLLHPIVDQMRQVVACRTTYLLVWLESHRHAVHTVVEKELKLQPVAEAVAA